MLRTTLLLCLIFTGLTCWGQIGGQRSYEFLNIPSNARLSGLGGVNVSLANQDVNLGFSNPALSGDTLSGLASFSYQSYFADVNIVTSIYQHDFGKWGSWFLGVNHINYGDFDSFDASGNSLGDFDASETAVVLGRSHQIRSFSFGASLKFLNSTIAGFSSNALVMDIGGVFIHPNQRFFVGLAIKNAGVILSDYTETSDSELPFDVQLGLSFKPLYMPLRFSLTGYNLNRGNLATFNDQLITQNQESASTFNKVFRHINVGAEVLFTKNFNLRFGYNHLVRQELKLESTAGGAGFSFGLMFRIKAFEFAYSRGGYHAAGGANNFTLTVNTNSFIKRK